MSMTQEEQRKLAIECGANVSNWIRTGNTRGSYTSITFTVNELGAYTAAVEAKERERCAVTCENLTLFAHEQPFYDEAAAVIRSLSK